jgi:polysaccharide export outer membrane protein
LRRFRVYLTGEVRNPGTYFAQGSDRISDIIEIGDGITDWADDTEIEVRGSDGTKKYFDLNNFYLEGDITQNPMVRGGDLIHIHSIDIRERYVIVEGNAEISSRLEERAGSGSNLFGVYPIKSDEALYNFLKRIGALSRKSNLEAIVLRRDSIEYKINLLEANNDYLNFILHHKDRIFIPPLMDRVYVKGQVLYPGAYAYYANYLAKDYVGNAGALEAAVDQEDYIVIRRKTGEQLQGGEILIEKGDIIIVDKSGGESFKDFIIVFTPMLSLAVTVLLLMQGSK